MMHGASVVMLLAALTASSCAYRRPSEIPAEPDWIVAVKSARVSENYPEVAQLAQHTWFDVKQGAEDSWLRLEVGGAGSGRDVGTISSDAARSDSHFGRSVKVLRLVTGEDARRIAGGLVAAADQYEDPEPDDYRAWPGPNSNTFTARLARRAPGLSFEHHHNAIGKDYTGIIRVGGTTTKAGLAIDTPILGVQVGFIEGVELHFLGLTLGASLYPPAIKIPILPRIGFFDW